MAETIQTENAPAAVGAYSQARVAGDLVFTAGQIALTADGDDRTNESVTVQTEQCLKNIKAVLEAAGCGMDDVLKMTIYLADIDDYATVNDVYSEHVADEPPARSAVGVASLPKGASVEIEAIATRG